MHEKFYKIHEFYDFEQQSVFIIDYFFIFFVNDSIILNFLIIKYKYECNILSLTCMLHINILFIWIIVCACSTVIAGLKLEMLLISNNEPFWKFWN